jgi:hypothetical protein
MTSQIGERAWVFVTKSEGARSWAANRGYDDLVDSYYSYDSNVGNSRRVSTGDLIVVREDDYVAGWGFVEFIEVNENATKEITRCPQCRKTNFSRRSTITPANKCGACRFEFDDHEALVTHEPVISFRAYYANTWTEAVRPLHFKVLETIIKTRDTFNAIRPLDIARLPAFLDRISARDVDLAIDIEGEDFSLILGGHTQSTVRRRRGQRQFRFKMIERFGETCAFSGDQPPQVLEAAHLYSFAERPEHHATGGLLLRRDFHALFDAHLMTVNPNSWKIEIAPRLHDYETYRPMSQRDLQVPSNVRPSQSLLETHYEKSRAIFGHN